MKQLKVAITGANGFLGRHLVRKLKKDAKFQLKFFNREKQNILDYKTLKSFVCGSDIIIHLAGVNRDKEVNFLRINTLGTQSILEAIKTYSPLSRLIFISTFQIYQPNNMYAFSKLFAEKLIQYYCEKLHLKSTILRISNIYGPGCRPFYNSVIATFVEQIKNEQPLNITGNGEQKRDYIYVKDVVRAIEKAIDFDQVEPISFFNIASNNLVTLNEIISVLKKNYSDKIIIKYNKSEESNNELSFTKDISETSNKLKWKPLISIEEGLKLAVESKNI